MKIWILEIGEPLPIEIGVRLHRYGLFSKWLASQGHDVTWWTSSFSHAPKKNFVDEDTEKIVDGVRMRFVYGKGYSRNVSFARIRHQAHFAQKFLKQAQGRPDVILAPIPTVDGAAAAVEYGREHQIPVIVDIRDLWPDEIRDLAPSFARPLAQLFLSRSYAKLGALCKGAAAICGVSQSYLDYGLKFSERPRALDFVFPLGYNVPSLPSEKLEDAEKWYAGLQIPPGAFVSCFFGTIGQFFDLDTVIRAARELGDNYYFVLGGDGSSLQKFRESSSDLKNIRFTGWLNAAQIQVVMKHSHVGLAPYARFAKMSLPNKPFEYMSAGLPVVSSIQHELKEILARHRAGITYVADSVSELKEALVFFCEDQKTREEFGKNAYNLFLNEFESSKVFQKALANIEKVVERER